MGDGGRISRTRSSLGRGEGRTGIQGKSCMQPGQRRPGREASWGAVQTEQLVLASSASDAHVIPLWTCRQAAGFHQWTGVPRGWSWREGLRSFSGITEMNPPPTPIWFLPLNGVLMG